MSKTTVMGLRLWIGIVAISLGFGLLHSGKVQAKDTQEVIGSWADKAYGEAFTQGRFSGAGIVFVQGGREPEVKLFGFADAEKRVPISVNQTLFRVQSVTKVFVALALLELKRKGKIESLDDPVNRYLKRIELDQISSHETTFRDLLTHRTGLDPLAYRFAADAPLDAVLSTEEIRKLLPPMVRPAGGLIQYSNVGYGIAGIAIEDITGQELGAAMEALIFRPLGMKNSFMGHPVNMPPNMAIPSGKYPNGDTYSSKDRAMNPLSHPILRGSGSLYTTFADMRRFVKWQVAAFNENKDALNTLLGIDGINELRLTNARNQEDLDAQSLGYLHREWNGHKTFEKGGAPGFNTRLLFSPESSLGIFTLQMDARPVSRPEDIALSFIGAGQFAGPPQVVGFDSRSGFLSTLWGAYVRPPAATDKDPGSPSKVTQIPHELLVGTYWFSQRPALSPWLIMYLDAFRNVKMASDGALLIDGRRYSRYGVNSFVPEQGESKPGQVVAFTQDVDSGSLSLRDIDQGFDKVDGLQNPDTLQKFGLLGLVLTLTGLFARLWRKTWLLQTLIAIAAAGIPASLYLGFAPGTSFETGMMLGNPARLISLQVFSNLVLLFGCLLALQLTRVISSSEGVKNWRDVMFAFHSLSLLVGVALLTLFSVQLNWIGNLIKIWSRVG